MKPTPLLLCCLFSIFACDSGSEFPVLENAGTIVETTIDDQGPRSPWGNTIGDLNGDGRPDIVVGGHSTPTRSLAERVLAKLGLQEPTAATGELVWYENPDWQRHVLSTDFRVRTDLAVGDIDNDGLDDVVVLADQGVFWLRNPVWTANEISHTSASKKFHDVELADLDVDGDLDVVLRNQSLFGYDSGDRIHLLIQEGGVTWREVILDVSHGEGLSVADIDGDGYADIVVNDAWLKNPGGQVTGDPWEPVDYTADWNWPDVYIDVHDINADGAPDILLAPSEPTGHTYRLSWFEAPTDGGISWAEHFVDTGIETVHHSVGAGDFDGDGHADIFTAKMNHGEDPDEVKVYLNAGDHMTWTKIVLSNSGAHSIQIADLDGDWDVEAVGTNWEFDDYRKDYAVTMWDFASTSPPSWNRHVIGDNGPWRNLFVSVADLDGDQLPDIVAGRSWFRNPGHIGGNWSRREFGKPLRTALLLHDFDGDGATDIFGSAWDSLLSEPGLLMRAKAKWSGEGYPGSGDGGKLVWARNNGRGKFSLYENIESVDGDFLQGIAVYRDTVSATLLLSWHQKGNGIQQVTIPADPTKQTWPIRTVTDYSQDEQLSVEDLTLDGNDEVVTGTSWIEPVRGWSVNRFHDDPTPPDRHVVIDLDSDGALDVVVGYEAISRQGKLAWYSAVASGSNPESNEYIIDFPIGPMSVSATDMDDDNDIDVIVGEHDLRTPHDAKLLLYSNLTGAARQWQKSVISRGDEHHCGAFPIDLDQDGDKDIVSIGWGHSRVLVFENLRLE